jgi:hypothetical protein
MRRRLKSNGEISRSASLTTTKVEPQMAAVRISSSEAMRVCFAMGGLLKRLILLRQGSEDFGEVEIDGGVCDLETSTLLPSGAPVEAATLFGIGHPDVRDPHAAIVFQTLVIASDAVFR